MSWGKTKNRGKEEKTGDGHVERGRQAVEGIWEKNHKKRRSEKVFRKPLAAVKGNGAYGTGGEHELKT